MRKVFQAVIFVVLFVSVGCQGKDCATSTASSATLPDNPENRAALTSRYFELVPFDRMMQETGDEVAKQLPPELQEEFKRYWASFMTTENTSKITEAAKKSFSKNMTTAELGSFVRFMEDPNGRSAMEKLKYYMADIMPLMQDLTMKAAAGFKPGAPPGDQVTK